MVEFCNENSPHMLFFHKFNIIVNDIKSLPRPPPPIYVMYFMSVGLTSTDRYFLRKRDIERSEAGAKPLVRG